MSTVAAAIVIVIVNVVGVNCTSLMMVMYETSRRVIDGA